jgi:fibro-slime domain-containing protein
MLLGVEGQEFMEVPGGIRMLPAIALLALVASGCANGTLKKSDSAGGASAVSASGVGGSFAFTLPQGEGIAPGNGGAGGARTANAEVWPPPGYVNVTNASYGAYALGPLISSTEGTASAGGSGGNGGSGTSPDNCSGLYGVVRDFRMNSTTNGHPDFENAIAEDRGIVEPTLGSDGKPVYAHPDGTTQTTHGRAYFDEWYRDVPDVNRSYLVGLHFVTNGNVLTFGACVVDNGLADAGIASSSYFPLDNQGYGNQNYGHNFSFTTEIHTAFTYNGGETFTFQGDDDVWVYIKDQLVIDLGGVHEQRTGSVNLDEQASKLGLVKGEIYPLAVFNAERHSGESNFRLDTTLAFTDCGQINGVPIIP